MDPILGSIMLFAGNFAPEGWFPCDGRLLSVQQYAALYSLLGTYYGGDGVNNFGIPDLRGRVPIGVGQGSGLTNRYLGEKSGYETVPLNSSQLPAHTHTASMQATGHIMADSAVGEDDSPAGNSLAKAPSDFYSTETPTTAMNANSVAVTGTVTVDQAGGNQAHANMQPYQALTYCIAWQGVYPQRP